MSASVKEKVSGSGFDLSRSNGEKLTVEEKADVVKRGQEVVNSVQIQRMSEVIALLDQDILTDEQKIYYITIDRLDEDWIEDKLRYQMLQAFLETVRDINNRIRHVKVILALRDDLVVRTFRMTRNPGYQSEKYKALYLNITWSRDELEKMLDLRISAMIKRQFTSEPLTLREILPESTSKLDYVKYFLDRTLLRPRDAIMFFNECIKKSEGRRRISREALVDAEIIYSNNRLDALSDEWVSDYPNLRDYAMILQQMPKNFKIFEVKEKIDERCVAVFARKKHTSDDLLHNLAVDKYAANEYDLAYDLISVLFKTGVVGLKRYSGQSVKWSFLGEEIPDSDISDDTYVEVHPAFYKALGL
ncbi:hypothetical protein F8S09_17475 [Deinococcus sp. SDU3-2]|uniref:Uncharacterized protein n=2 Tax=Deinococcus terrestris TaxID=2651870 RepID=A0A7X1TT35_9DEIO|nr:hypothetical protein [Deinococcus terrestris]MPY68440.1 hypothetical protein [Deinococcus terrestris]